MMGHHFSHGGTESLELPSCFPWLPPSFLHWQRLTATSRAASQDSLPDSEELRDSSQQSVRN